jgi:hypothetical protein
MAYHTHSLVQDLCGAVVLGRYPETWVQMLQQWPLRLMVTRQEMEESALAALRPLQEAVEQLEGAGGMHGVCVSTSCMHSTAKYR